MARWILYFICVDRDVSRVYEPFQILVASSTTARDEPLVRFGLVRFVSRRRGKTRGRRRFARARAREREIEDREDAMRRSPMRAVG